MSSSVKPTDSKDTADTNWSEKHAEGNPGQERPRHKNRVNFNVTRSHKSFFRLTDSKRSDSREQMYRVLSACEGQSHE